ncbi:MAG: potassium-transporting ATPase subunit KdpA [Gammaproteobacteria bacterium]|nr:potassium-transporting ATPase subunit KdpA [Gammaproteobacteria bacterium]
MISLNAIAQITCYLFLVLCLARPLGGYIGLVYQGQYTRFTKILRPIENGVYRLCKIDQQGMTWQQYAAALLCLNVLGLVGVFCIQYFQGELPLNPQHFTSPNVWVALNTAVSFVTNTNWQAYAGESTLSNLTQMLALTSQNFLSAGTGMAILMVLIRSLSVSKGQDLGNYWVDMVRGVIYILLPLSIILALILASQGVIQSLQPNRAVENLQRLTHPDTVLLSSNLPMGPVASQIAIKQLGTNGGGFFNANAAHPYENPTPLTNALELLAILLIPAALVFAFGIMIQDRRQSYAILGVMLILLLPTAYFGVVAEQQGNPALHALGIEGPNYEGKESRFGMVSSVLWSSATTATANGSVNSMLDSYMPLGGLMPLWLMNLGEIVFGGVGSGLYGMLAMIIIAVFIGGLMVGRSPEYLGKKIEPFDMKMASIAVLLMPLLVLLATAVALGTSLGRQALGNPGAHGLTEVLYGMTSMTANNGSAFSGLHADEPFYVIIGSFLMFIGRYGVAIPILALSGALMKKQRVPPSLGTLSTSSPLFIGLLLLVIVTLGALSFLPTLSLGPIVEHVMLWMPYG